VAGLLARGSLRMPAFPGLAQWHDGIRSPHTVAGAADA